MSEDKFYSVEGCEVLSADIAAFEDTIKYLHSVSKDSPDAQLLTPELLAAFDDVAGACENMLHAYSHYKAR